MKIRFAAMAGLLIYTLLLTIQGAVGRTAKLSIDTLSLGCQEAVTAERTKGPSHSHIFFTLGSPITLRDDYVIQVFQFKDNTKEHQVVAVIEKGPESVETARITGICLDTQLNPPHTPDKRDIEFNGSIGDKIHIHFRLNKKPGETAHLQRHYWKPAPNDSVWMSGPFLPGEPQHYPNQDEWPDCLKPKNVTTTGDRLSFDFDPCLTAGSEDVTYRYLLLLDRKKADGELETVKIDPQIINHPH